MRCADAQAVHDDVVTRTRTTYDGPLEIGEDLMAIEIGGDVRVLRGAAAGPPRP